MPNLVQLKKELNQSADKKQAIILQRFFKTGPGQYGAGDIFLGIKVLVLRQAAKKQPNLSFKDLQSLLNSEIHEQRLTALFILIGQYQKANQANRGKIFNFYLKNTKNINNWDLVDLSSPNIVGDFLLAKPRGILYRLARSKNLWEKRIAILATYTFIKNNQYGDTLKIAKILLNDDHDLIHKAVGWMLREVGKRNQKTEEIFLQKYYRQMPRTMLRYAIERFTPAQRKAYLKKCSIV